VDYTASLLDSNWVCLGVVTAAASSASVQDAGIAEVGKRFYRIRQLGP
jgi:hypothetical protein